MLMNFCLYLSERGHVTEVLTYNPLIVSSKAPRREKLNDFVTVNRIPWIGKGLFNIFEHYPLIQFFYLVPALSLSAIIFLLIKKKKDRPDVIHVFGLSGVVAGGIAGKLYGIPCVADMCTVYRFPQRPLLKNAAKLFLGLCDYIRGNNLNGRAELLNAGLPPEKVGVITPPVDDKIFYPRDMAAARMKLGLPKDKFVALFVGRMVPSKGVEIAVGATRNIPGDKVVFVFVGEGPLQTLVKDAAASDKRIIVVDNVPHHGLAEYYSAADLLMCAPVDKDLLAFVGREALMCGLPILAPDAATYFGITYPVNKDLLPENVGRVFRADPGVLAEVVTGLIKSHGTKDYPFVRSACVDYGVKSFSLKVLDWVGDAYVRAEHNFLSQSE